ncbi:hypothetical protein PG993_003794 [Apiospora rasikravindrae]|uniref:Uncharacterized protein n=1 Tax=Apiospora rasikravindrae TaxID=990691 RepID=A0ABR1U0J0_9PEZI
MKYAHFATAALLPMACAAGDLDGRSKKYEISNLTATCYDAYETHYCVWDLMVSASDKPNYGAGVETMCESPTGALVGCGPGESGSYSLSTTVHEHNNTLLVTLKSRDDMAAMAMPLEDFVEVADPPATTYGGKSAMWLWRGGESFSVPAKDLEVSDDDPPFIAPPKVVEWDLASASASGIATAADEAPTRKASSSMASATAAPTASATDDAATSDSANPSDHPSGATRDSAFAGVVFFIGIMGLLVF